MKQHQINLITPRMLDRARAGRRTRKILGTCVVLVAGMLLTATHARLQLEQARTRHETTTILADQALALERSLADVDARMHDVHSFMPFSRSCAPSCALEGG